MSKLPRVILMGRTNVGKSTLFNRLSQKVKSITLDRVGVTRDFLQDTVCWQEACFTLIDTGGFQLKKTQDPIYERVSSSVLSLLETADIILFVVDGISGIMQEELDLAKLVHKLNKTTILVINKSDIKETSDHLYQFDRLGFKADIVISAEHGHNVADLLDMIVATLPVKISHVQEEKTLQVAIIGKPNVGKSSLLNALLDEERAIVSPVAGTTREPISATVTFFKEDINITDTPGVRKKRGVTDALELLMVKRAMQTLKGTDIVLLVVDAADATLSDQELKLAFYAFEQYKALIILFNKYDLVDEEIQKELDFNLEPYEHLLDKVQLMRISCKTGKNIGKLLAIIKKVADRYTQSFANDELTKLFKQALAKKQLFHQSSPLFVYKAKQVKTAPITIVMHVNEPDWFGQSQLAFFENVLRQAYDLKGVPIRFITRKMAR